MKPVIRQLEAAHRLVELRRAVGFPGRDQRVPGLVVLGAVEVGFLLAVRAQRAHQALSHHPVQRRVQQVRRHAELEQARHRAGGVVGVQRGEHEVAGERRLHRHLGGLEVADLAHHDDVGVLAHQRAHALGEAQIDLLLHLHLVERGLDHLDRVLDGADVHLDRRERLQRRVQGGGLARAGGGR